jgi:hypothetical protein
VHLHVLFYIDYMTQQCNQVEMLYFINMGTMEDDNENDRHEAMRVLGGYAQIFLDAMDGAIDMDKDLPSTSIRYMSDEGLSSYNNNDNTALT